MAAPDDFPGCAVLDEFYRVAFRKRIYETIGELQADLHASKESTIG